MLADACQFVDRMTEVRMCIVKCKEFENRNYVLWNKLQYRSRLAISGSQSYIVVPTPKKRTQGINIRSSFYFDFEQLMAEKSIV